MIQRLENKNPEVAALIRQVFQASYAVEAELLGALDFPPLRRPLSDFIEIGNVFFGFFEHGELAGVIEIIPDTAVTHIQSLVVHPANFRKGIGSALLTYVLKRCNSPVFTVETGAENGPATTLYRKFDFREILQYDTDHGVRKVRFEKRRASE
ncbi:GNAT family N-acetyltransferase [Robiginitalea aurantiaca]|uniref:GNAT family N-acetyltransferase n=1 Tax=Robiginitalea aurantiaca TaxID=3056915 RepID=A0ABT7WCP7_9FLAO|nr:GNAT family N-acetyltransferase [Robiginitalea aurantiaca]MDM9630690.1 GNAT family N-acetyltransferase [Robiginitalea aurantiaca]